MSFHFLSTIVRCSGSVIAMLGLCLLSGAMGLASPAALAASPDTEIHSKQTWQEIGKGSLIVDKDSQPGIIVGPSFSDVSRSKLITAVICNKEAALNEFFFASCRPATSIDQGGTWIIHDSPNFAEIDEKGWGQWGWPVAVRSPVNPNRIYFAVPGHPWNTVAPHGGLWRSDDGGRTWFGNLVADQSGEAGLISSIIADPFNADTLYVNRGYDYGNVSVSHDAGATFEIICGNDNVSKTGPDEYCGSAATWVINFTTQEFYYKHHFVSEGVRVNLDGSAIRQYPFAGLIWDSSANSGWYVPPQGPSGQNLQYDTPIRGLTNRGGGRAVRFTADGSAMLYQPVGGGTSGELWKASTDFSTGSKITNISFGGGHLILAHLREACTWIIQSTDTQLQRTINCGSTWRPIPTDGLTDKSPIISAVFAPDYSGTLIIFTKEGRRFKSRQNAF